MKKAIYLSLIILSFFATSCSNNDDNLQPINVTLTINVTGTLSNSPSIEYRNESGELKTETLTGNWNKSFTVNAGYTLFLKAKGTVNGNVEIKATATGNGNAFNEDMNFGGNNQDFDHTITTTLN